MENQSDNSIADPIKQWIESPEGQAKLREIERKASEMFLGIQKAKEIDAMFLNRHMTV